MANRDLQIQGFGVTIMKTPPVGHLMVLPQPKGRMVPSDVRSTPLYTAVVAQTPALCGVPLKSMDSDLGYHIFMHNIFKIKALDCKIFQDRSVFLHLCIQYHLSYFVECSNILQML